jgi:hypothetical protein
VSASVTFLGGRSRLFVSLGRVSLPVWARFTPQIGDIITIRLATGTFLIVVVILGSLGVITGCQNAACDEHGQKASQ